jgi:hypothetical protein
VTRFLIIPQRREPGQGWLDTQPHRAQRWMVRSPRNVDLVPFTSKRDAEAFLARRKALAGPPNALRQSVGRIFTFQRQCPPALPPSQLLAQGSKPRS